MYKDKVFIAGVRYALESPITGHHSVKASHLGPRGKEECKGGTIKIRRADLRRFNLGDTVEGFCFGCGFVGDVSPSFPQGRG
ncbi:MAG: hypothetical protein WCV93_05385 [Candidatus Shapirobacteria bacterium]